MSVFQDSYTRITFCCLYVAEHQQSKCSRLLEVIYLRFAVNQRIILILWFSSSLTFNEIITSTDFNQINKMKQFVGFPILAYIFGPSLTFTINCLGMQRPGHQCFTEMSKLSSKQHFILLFLRAQVGDIFQTLIRAGQGKPSHSLK